MPSDERARRRLKLRDLDILLVVTQTGSMGAAARQLHISQPAVSRAVADLEDAVGVRLLDRTRRGVKATPYGVALAKRGTVIFNELRGGIRDIESLADPTAGELRIGTPEPVAAAMIAPIADYFSLRYPRVTFHVITGETRRLLRELGNRNVELVISRLSQPVDDPFRSDVLFHDQLVLAAGLQNPLTRRRRLSLEDLSTQLWTLQSLDTYFGTLAGDALRASGLSIPPLTMATTSFSLRHELLATGRFITVLPGFFLKLPRRHPTLRALPIALPKTTMPVALVTLAGRSLSPLAQLFIERVRALTAPLATKGR
jgi:DNA-binding transcriptional LysR family regulator